MVILEGWGSPWHRAVLGSYGGGDCYWRGTPAGEHGEPADVPGGRRHTISDKKNESTILWGS